MRLKTALIALLLTTAVAPAAFAAQAFEGEWTCEGQTVIFKDGTYSPVDDAEPIRIEQVAQNGDDFGLTIEDGVQFNLRDVSEAAMTIDTSDGSRFACTRN